MNKKMQAKDFITVGVFTAIMLVIMMAIAMLGFIPVFIPLLSVLVPLISGIPFMLFATKSQKFGMVTLMGVLIGLVMGMMGHGIFAFVAGPLCGLVADLIMKSGDYKSSKKDSLACGVFFLTIIGNYIPIVLAREAYHTQLVETGYGVEYADALMKLVPDWSLIPLTIAAFVFGMIGAQLGKVMLKKHFKRAGIV